MVMTNSSNIANVKAVAAANVDGDKPVWITEGNWGTTTSSLTIKRYPG
jgi:hypothetical protein